MYEKPKEHFPFGMKLITRNDVEVKFSVRGKPRKAYMGGIYLGLAIMFGGISVPLFTQGDGGVIAASSGLVLGVLILLISSCFRSRVEIKVTKDSISFDGKKYDPNLWGGFGVSSDRYLIFNYGDQPQKFSLVITNSYRNDILNKMNELVLEGTSLT